MEKAIMEQMEHQNKQENTVPNDSAHENAGPAAGEPSHDSETSINTQPDTFIEPPRKTIRAFLASEKGGITKKALVDSAVAAGFVFALSHAVSAQVIHSNALTLTSIDQPKATGKHSHHSSHSSHSSASMK